MIGIVGRPEQRGHLQPEVAAGDRQQLEIAEMAGEEDVRLVFSAAMRTKMIDADDLDAARRRPRPDRSRTAGRERCIRRPAGPCCPTCRARSRWISSSLFSGKAWRRLSSATRWRPTSGPRRRATRSAKSSAAVHRQQAQHRNARHRDLRDQPVLGHPQAACAIAKARSRRGHRRACSRVKPPGG